MTDVPVRRLIIELNEKTNEALSRRKEKEKLNESTLFNRAMQIYDILMTAQEARKPIIVDGMKYTIT